MDTNVKSTVRWSNITATSPIKPVNRRKRHKPPKRTENDDLKDGKGQAQADDLPEEDLKKRAPDNRPDAQEDSRAGQGGDDDPKTGLRIDIHV